MRVLLYFNRLFGLMFSSNIPNVTNIQLQELNWFVNDTIVEGFSFYFT